MRRCLILTGLTLTVALTLLAREIAVLFGGLEPAASIALGVWLLLAGAACGLSGRISLLRRAGATTFAFLIAFTGLLTPLTLLALRAVPSLWDIQRDNPLQLLLMCASIPLPLCLVYGLLIALALIIRLRGGGSPGAVATETIGFVAAGALMGGLLAAYPLRAISPLQSLMGTAALHCLTAFIVWFNAPRRTELGWLLIPPMATSALIAATYIGPVLDFHSQTWERPGLILRGSYETPAGCVQALEDSGRMEYYLNGARMGTQGGEPAIESERRTLLALLAHPAPRRLLIIAPVPGDSMAAALKLPWLQIDYLPVEDGAALAAERHAPASLDRALTSQRVRFVREMDPQLYVRQARGQYDVVLVELPITTSGAFARFMSPRFLADARRALAGNGLLVLAMPGEADSSETASMSAAVSLLRGMRSPSSSLFALRSGKSVLLLNYFMRNAPFPRAADLTNRAARWGLRGTALRQADISSALERRQVESLAASLKRAPPAPSSEQRPLPWSLAAAGWTNRAKAIGLGAVSPLFNAGMLPVLLAAVTFGGALLVWGLFASSPLRPVHSVGLLFSAAAAVATGASGFLALQAASGEALPKLGLFIGAGIAGAGAGMLLTTRSAMTPETGPAHARETFSPASLLIAQSLCAALGGMAWLLTGILEQPLARMAGVCLALAVTFVSGLVLGARLPLALTAGEGGDKETAGRCSATGAVGWLCAGGGLGAIACGLCLTPSMGPADAAFAAAVLCLIPLPLMALSFRGRRRRPGYRQFASPGTGAAQQARTTYPGFPR